MLYSNGKGLSGLSRLARRGSPCIPPSGWVPFPNCAFIKEKRKRVAPYLQWPAHSYEGVIALRREGFGKLMIQVRNSRTWSYKSSILSS